MSIQQALNFTLPAEGGFVDNVHDAGGATNHGITQATYDRFRNSKGLAPNPVKDISDSEVQTIYEQMYWIPAHCAELPPKLGICHFDWSVNHGVPGAIKTLQDTLGIKADGIFGVATRTALENVPDEELVGAYLDARRTWYRARVQQKPDQEVFLNGWLNRVDELQKYVDSL